MAACPSSSSSTRSARPATGPSARSRWRSAARTCAWRPPSCCPSRARPREAPPGRGRHVTHVAVRGLGWQVFMGTGSGWV
eukprot:scaffold15999_cov73-Phaeocystis_antarctica.AAC.2